jgi:glycerol kinase
LGREITYCLEGSVFIAGAAIQWLRDEMGLLSSAGESESVALSVPDNGGVYFVPALVGLGAPHWDMRARGMIIGLTRGSSKGHIVRAALEAMAFQTRDVIQCMAADSRLPLRELRADGGAAQNNLLLQFQSDILDTPVLRPRTVETTALGAAYLAGLGVGYWKDREEIQTNWSLDKKFQPSMKPEQRERLCAGWDRAVERSKKWVLEEERREP